MARERVFEYFSARNGTPFVLLRLNYAIDLHYGVLLDIATKVYTRTPVDLTMGYVNVIWQGDANSYCLRSLLLCQSPPLILNVTGAETLPVRRIAHQFAERLGAGAIFENNESATALLSNASKLFSLLGRPAVPIDDMIEAVSGWVLRGGPVWNKPTHFETRTGAF